MVKKFTSCWSQWEKIKEQQLNWWFLLKLVVKGKRVKSWIWCSLLNFVFEDTNLLCLCKFSVSQSSFLSERCVQFSVVVMYFGWHHQRERESDGSRCWLFVSRSCMKRFLLVTHETVLDCLLLIVACIYALFAFLFVECRSLYISLVATAYSLLCLLVVDVLKIILVSYWSFWVSNSWNLVAKLMCILYYIACARFIRENKNI